MNALRTCLRLGAAGALIVAAQAGCGVDLLGWATADAPPDFSRPRDMAFKIVFDPLDLAREGDLMEPPGPCQPGDLTCRRVRHGPPDWPFPLMSDDPRNPLERDNGIFRDFDGWLRIDNVYPTHYNAAYITNTQDATGGGTVSKIDTVAVRELARYLSVTCSSLPTGRAAPCDGTNGCCSLDDPDRRAARLDKMPEPGHQPVQRMGNQPSRTSVDFNLDLLVANRAPGGQASVTKIAGSFYGCADRNHNKKIESSSDTDGNGWIDVDCNGDGAPDDIAGVQKKPCSNGMPQEFYGLDDECVLWTTNVFTSGDRATALSLAGGDSGASDVWVASPSGKVLRIDGVAAKIKAEIALPADCLMGTGPWGTAVDATGVAWVTEKGAGKLCWFDTRAPHTSGVVRDPQWGAVVGEGLTMDRDQNVWVGGGVARYTPDRTDGRKKLGAGWWTRIDGATGLGIAADSRSANEYFVHSCQGASVLQIPASKLKVMKADQVVMNPGWPTIKMPCTGVAVDSNQHIWGVDGQTSTRALVDKLGMITQPNVNGQPMGKNRCPAGDSCPNLGAEVYSDFTTFGWRGGHARPVGSYTLLVPGCTDDNGDPADTSWWNIEWDADVPPNTSLAVHARSSDGSTFADPAWGAAQFTPDFITSPAILMGNLDPNYYEDSPEGVHDGWLMVEFILKTSVQNASPELKSFTVNYTCPNRTLP